MDDILTSLNNDQQFTSAATGLEEPLGELDSDYMKGLESLGTPTVNEPNSAGTDAAYMEFLDTNALSGGASVVPSVSSADLVSPGTSALASSLAGPMDIASQAGGAVDLRGLSFPSVDLSSAQNHISLSPSLVSPGILEMKSPTLTNAAENAVVQETESKAAQIQRKLRNNAESVVSSAWKSCSSPGEFVAAVRAMMPSEAELEPTSPSTVSSVRVALDAKSASSDKSRRPQWRLEKEAESATLDSLLSRVLSADAASTRIISYLRHAVISGLVSPQATLRTIVRSASKESGRNKISPRVQTALAQFLASLLPHYTVASQGDALTTECVDYLTAVTMVFSLPTVHLKDRTIALARAAGRRNQGAYKKLLARLNELEVGSPPQLPRPVQSSVTRLRKGLNASVTTLEAIAKSGEGLRILEKKADIADVIQASIVPITAHVFGAEIASAFSGLWSQKEPRGGDIMSLVQIARAAENACSTPPASRYDFPDRIRACEALVQHLYIRSKRESPSISSWSSYERLKRLLRDALPQIRRALKTEFTCLIVATAVIGAAAICTGPATASFENSEKLKVAQFIDKVVRELSEILGELCNFAVSTVEEAAVAEDSPTWRSFGVWLLLLGSRCGEMLRNGKCQHVRAAKVLRAWSRVPASKGSGEMGNAAAAVALSMIDASDRDGSDETLYALCSDLVQ